MLDASSRKSITFTAWRGGFASFSHLRIFRHESCDHSLVRIHGCMPTLNFSSSESLSCSLHGLCNMLSPGRSRHILLNIIPTCFKRLQVVILEFVFHHQESYQFVLSLFGESLPLQVPCNNFFRVCLQSWNPLRNQEKLFQLQMRHAMFRTRRTLDFSDPFHSCSRVSEAF